MNPTIEPFHGLPCQRIQNRALRVDYLSGCGPRIVRLELNASSENLFAELPNEVIETTQGVFHARGGHRLWHAPEDNPRSYIPDDRPIAIEAAENRASLTQPVEVDTGIEKRIEIELVDDAPVVLVRHTLINRGMWPVELAAWAITQLPPGGLIILPEPSEPSDRSGVLPNRHLALWPYTRWNDPRFQPVDGFVCLTADPTPTAIKVGLLNHSGWVAYYRAGVFFRKFFDPQVDRAHPDFNCNVESYSKETFVELETIGALERLEPGQSTQHTERWEITAGLDLPATVENLPRLLERLQH